MTNICIIFKKTVYLQRNYQFTMRHKKAGSCRTTPRIGHKPSAYSLIVIRCRTYTGANILDSLRISKYLN